MHAAKLQRNAVPNITAVKLEKALDIWVSYLFKNSTKASIKVGTDKIGKTHCQSCVPQNKKQTKRIDQSAHILNDFLHIWDFDMSKSNHLSLRIDTIDLSFTYDS